MYKILLVEDNPDDSKHITSGLGAHAQITTVADGESALKKYYEALQAQAPYDFLLVDVSIPKKDGFDILKEIRQHEESDPAIPEARIIMTTTFKDSLMENYNMGWDEFLTKPIDPEVLRKHLDALAATR